jgi:diguanylate cyclase (GGDEF)-like protein
MAPLLRRSVGRKLVVAVAAPAVTVTALLLFLVPRSPPGLAAAGAVVLAVAAVAVQAAAVRWLLERPLAKLAAGLRRAREGDFLHRLPVESEDELGGLADSFNGALASMTDLHARRIDDERELALKSKLEARVKELTLLIDVSRRLNATLELDRLCADLTARVGEGLGEHAFALLLAEEGTGDLVVRGVSGLPSSVNGTRIRAGEGPAGWAAQARATVLVPDTASDDRRPVLPWQQAAHGSILCTPMVHPEGCAGVLAFFRPAADAFPADEVRLLEAVAGQAATAIENARLHQRMVRLSQSDALTGVHNRRSLFARLEMEAERSDRFEHATGVALVDVDRFREYNDAHGHAAGDSVLRRVAAVLQGSVRKVDLVARYGGEEFAVLLPRADRAAALEVAEKLRAAVADARIGDGPAPVTISVGVASWPEDGRDLSTLMDSADAALFAAKRAGRDAVRAHAPGMRVHPGRRRDARTTADAEAAGN